MEVNKVNKALEFSKVNKDGDNKANKANKANKDGDNKANKVNKDGDNKANKVNKDGDNKANKVNKFSKDGDNKANKVNKFSKDGDNKANKIKDGVNKSEDSLPRANNTKFTVLLVTVLSWMFHRGLTKLTNWLFGRTTDKRTKDLFSKAQEMENGVCSQQRMEWQLKLMKEAMVQELFAVNQTRRQTNFGKSFQWTIQNSKGTMLCIWNVIQDDNLMFGKPRLKTELQLLFMMDTRMTTKSGSWK